MAKFLLSFILPLVLNLLLSCNCEFIYTAVAPLKIFPGEGYEIVTTLEKVDHPPVQFKYELTARNARITIASSETIKLDGPGHKITTLEVNPATLVADTYDLKVTATDITGKVEQASIAVTREAPKASVLVQTDRVIYKPGDTVKFRVFLLDGFLVPFEDNKTATITVYDSSRNVIKLWKSKEVQSGRGFLSEEFELSEEPNLGNWSIQVKPDHGAGTGTPTLHHFSVEEYVLPKYQVEINPSPSFLTYKETKFTVEVRATYTYGKPVSGECTIELSHDSRVLEAKLSVSKASKLKEGKGLAKMDFDLKSDIQYQQQGVEHNWGRDFQLFASCRNNDSGNVLNATRPLRMYKYPYKIELVDRPKKLIPEVPINVTFKVSTVDNNHPVSDENPNAFTIEIDNGISIMRPIPANGLVTLAISAGRNRPHHQISVTYKSQKQTFILPSTRQAGESYVLIDRVTQSPAEGQPMKVNVRTGKAYLALNLVLVSSRGFIIHSERIQGSGGDKEQVIKFQLPSRSYPKVKLVIYLMDGDNYISDGELEVDVKADRKALVVTTSEKNVEPGANVTIRVSGRGHPNSVAGLRAVDQSVLLLRNDEELTVDKVNSVGYQSNHNGLGHGLWKEISKNGIGLLTNGKSEQLELEQRRLEERIRQFEEQLAAERARQREREREERVRWNVLLQPARVQGQGTATSAKRDDAAHVERNYAPAPPPPVTPASPSASPTPPETVHPAPPPIILVRSSFPETWIWEELGNPQGQLTIHKQVPDTITSWFISGFQIDPEQGLDLTEGSRKLTVFRPFFISLNLPYSVVKGEVLFLQVLVYNYQDIPVTAEVTLNNPEGDFQFLEEAGQNDGITGVAKLVEVNASSVSSVVFPIIPSKLGSITLSAKATTSGAGDAVRRTLLVRPPGLKHTQNSAILINLLKDSIFRQEEIYADFPEGRVPGADFLKVRVTGDVLGDVIENLDKLIKIPTGCGEQNMIHFVPDIVILDYLNSTGQLTPEVEAKAKSYLEKGYQRQLTYLRDDGSYSVFGKRDRVGSTWLTAFVTRAFIQAKKWIHIDDAIIKKSLRFLLMKQNSDGSFREDGFVYDKSLQGGTAGSGSNKLAITAYTLVAIVKAKRANISMEEVPPANRDLDNVITSGVEFLVKETFTDGDDGDDSDAFTDVYAANLISYLLHLITKLDNGNNFLVAKLGFTKLTEDFARKNRSNGTIYWRQIERPDSSSRRSSRLRQTMKVNPATVEVTSYGLLTYLLQGRSKLAEAVFVAKWLISQRNPNGGFLSTQDTVMGISALGQFAKAINSKGESNVKVKLTYGWDDSGQNPNTHHFYIGKDNRTVLQEYLLPGNTTEVSIEAEGEGKAVALAQLTWSYYMEAVDSSPAFDLKTNVTTNNDGKNLNMEIQFFYNRGRGKSSNMAILEANAPSGYAFDMVDLEGLRQSNKFKRYELEDQDSKVQLYFDYVDSEKITLNLKAYRMYLVTRHAQGVVKIYDYYDNTQAAQNLYDVPAIDMCQICRNERGCDLSEC